MWKISLGIRTISLGIILYIQFDRLQCEYAAFLGQIYDNFLMYTNKVILSVAFIPIWVTVYPPYRTWR